jgi:hypothetical protein
MSKTEDKRQIFERVCYNIAGGDSVSKACEKEGKPENFYFRYLADNIDDDEVCKLSIHAREMKAYGYFEKCEQVLEELRLGGCDAQTARVLFDGYLRLAGKANQKTFGDKQEITHAGSIVVMPTVKVNGKDFKMDIGEDVD